ncbi:MAG: glycosyltransferase family 39 protein [Deltaproteobacteria bacterium]|nr:glycosyltransferase family 39 protein [Deltaproteobacteria bacterium]
MGADAVKKSCDDTECGCTPNAAACPVPSPEHPRRLLRVCLASAVVALILFGLPHLVGSPLPKERQLAFVWMVATLFGIGSCYSVFPFPEATKSRFIPDAAFFLAAFAVLGGSLIRFYALDFDFPHFYHPDEARKSGVILRMIKGDTLDPGYFLHPSLLLYSALFVSKVLTFLGVEFAKDSFLAVYSGRIVSAFLGSVSIILVYAIGSKAFSRMSGAFAAALLAFLPLHVTCSRYMKEDIIFSTFGLLSLVFVLNYLRSARSRDLLIASFIGGISMGSKYTGVLSSLFIALAPVLLLGGQAFSKRTVLLLAKCGAFFALAFLLCSPFSILNFDKFAHDFVAEGSHVVRGHGGISIPAWGELFTYHLDRSIMAGATPYVVLIGLFGAGVLWTRRRREDLLILFGIVLFYLAAELIKAKPMPQPERYILPVLAFLSLAGAEGLRAIWCRTCISWWAIGALLIASPMVRSIDLASELQDDTRLKSARWITENLPKRARVMLIGEVKYLPRISQVRFKQKMTGAERGRDRIGVDALRQSESKYIVTTSLSYDRFLLQPNADPVLKEIFLSYDREFELLKEIRPRFGSYGFHNPTIKIYRIR